MRRLCLTIDSNLEDVSLVAVVVNKMCVYLGLGDAQARQVELCIAEAATNAVRHAYHGQTGETISIMVSIDIGCLHVEVCDTGTPMLEEQVERLIHGVEFAEVDGRDRSSLLEGGRGLQIIHDLMDEIAYTRDGELNRLQLTKRIAIRR